MSDERTSTDTEGMAATLMAIRGFAERVVETARRRRASGADVATIRKYAIVSTPRTGSTLFCTVLEQNGLGWPVEWFNTLYMQEVARVLGTAELDFWQYVQTVVLGSYDPDKMVFGVNFHVGQYLWLKQQGADLLSLGFDRRYYLERRDKVRQAYSLAKSKKSGFWSRETEIAAGHTEPVHIRITLGEFCSALSDVVAECEVAASLLPSFDGCFSFEDLVGGGMRRAVGQIAGDLSLKIDAPFVELPMEPQSNDFDREQMKRLLADLGGHL